MRAVGALLLLATVCCGPAVGPAARRPSAATAARVQELVDLFARARLAGDGGARRRLVSELGLPLEARGEAATRAVLGELIEAARHVGHEDLADLLDEDLAELQGDDPGSIARHRRELAATLEARSDPAAATALLALWASCAQPLADAADGPPSRRALVASHCRHSLPDETTSWAGWFVALGELLHRAARVAPRLAALIESLASRQAALADRIARDGLEPPDVRRLAPSLPDGSALHGRHPLRSSPWLIIDGDVVVIGRARYGLHDHALAERIEPLFGRDPARQLTLLVSGASTAEAIDVAGAMARLTGKSVLDLVVRGADGAPAVLPLDLGVGFRRDRARTVAEVAPSLVLIARPEGPLVRAPAGDLALPPGEGGGVPWLARAFPDETEVSVAIDPTARLADLMTLLVDAERAFRRLVLLPRIPSLPPDQGFAARARRRAAAVVEVSDTRGASIPAAPTILRGCYLDALDRRPDLTLSLLTPLDEAATADPALARCLQDRVRGLAAPGVRLRILLRPR